MHHAVGAKASGGLAAFMHSSLLQELPLLWEIIERVYFAFYFILFYFICIGKNSPTPKVSDFDAFVITNSYP